MYEAAMKNGALGGKLLGAGGGGFLLLIVPPDKKDAVRRKLGNELKFKLSNYGSKIIFDIKE
jgi:D-glycero-alpha-D-manno-heptose-7-phosphate kinase